MRLLVPRTQWLRLLLRGGTPFPLCSVLLSQKRDVPSLWWLTWLPLTCLVLVFVTRYSLVQDYVIKHLISLCGKFQNYLASPSSFLAKNAIIVKVYLDVNIMGLKFSRDSPSQCHKFRMLMWLLVIMIVKTEEHLALSSDCDLWRRTPGLTRRLLKQNCRHDLQITKFARLSVVYPRSSKIFGATKTMTILTLCGSSPISCYKIFQVFDEPQQPLSPSECKHHINIPKYAIQED